MKSECFLQGVQSHAAKAREPRQVRKEAAVSGQPHVPQGSLRRLQVRHGGFAL